MISNIKNTTLRLTSKILDALYQAVPRRKREPEHESIKIRTNVVCYGRTIEVGRFGRGRSGKVWFGWEAEVGKDETPESVLTALKQRADEQEIEERKSFDKRRQDSRFD